jgi:type IV pilus assembly protein PilV
MTPQRPGQQPGQRRRNRPGHRPGHKPGQAGISLIEVLIVIVLFAFGLLGMVGLQARATQFSVSAEDNNRAALLADELASQMWGSGTVNLPTATVTAWNTRVADATGVGLPNGVGAVTVTGNVARITVSWRPPHHATGDTRRYSTEVLIP